MIVDMEVKASAEEIFKRFGYLWKFLDVDKKRTEITELETKMAAPKFLGRPLCGAIGNI